MCKKSLQILVFEKVIKVKLISSYQNKSNVYILPNVYIVKHTPTSYHVIYCILFISIRYARKTTSHCCKSALAAEMHAIQKPIPNILAYNYAIKIIYTDQSRF
jgi:hypothetical protein